MTNFPGKPVLRSVSQGDRPSASQHNKITEFLTRVGGTHGYDGTSHSHDKFTVYNCSGETIPAYGVMRIITAVTEGVEARRLIVGKPNSTPQPLYLINGPFELKDKNPGVGFLLTGRHDIALTSSAAGVGEIWGPTSGSWELSPEGVGFAIVQNIDDTIAGVVQYVTEESEVDSTTTTTTTTTTAQDCDGRCKWEWDGYEWHPDTDECAPTTTTTSTSTSTTTTTASGTTTTTTTCDPADVVCCGYFTPTTTTTTASGTTTTTTSTSTTTTTAAPGTGCRCQYPTFCLDVADVGACTWTFCADAEPVPPPCQSTTTTTTTTRDCTGCELICSGGHYVFGGTCGGGGCDSGCMPQCAHYGESCVSGFRCDDCTPSTTTTAGCPESCVCGGGCEWLSLPSLSGWGWVKISDDCCITCPCSPPETAAPAECTGAHTDCVVLPRPGTPTPTCDGDCEFWWVPSTARWYLTRSSCYGTAVPCSCRYPTVPGDYCGPAVVKCLSTTTTTTTAGPYEPCYGSTTSTTTTTTTTPACGVGCIWECVDAEWEVLDDNCNPGCECLRPAINCTEDCERQFTNCRTTTTTTAGPTTTTTTTSTTTTSTTTTTTTSTTTTTTTAACTGSCNFIWSDQTTRDMWIYNGGGCSNYDNGCQCVAPASQGSGYGQTTDGPCLRAPCGVCVWTFNIGTGLWTSSSTYCTGGCGCGSQPSFTPTVTMEVTVFCE